MDYVSTKEAAEAWGVSPRLVQRLLLEGRVPDAKRCGEIWLIPRGAEKPPDPRRERRRAASAQPRRHLLPRRCVMLTMSTLYGKAGRADAVAASLEGDENARTLFAAELSYLRGDAESAAAAARALIEETDGFDTRLGALITLANSAMYMADGAMWSAARDAIAQTECRDGCEAATRDCCLASADSALYDRRSFPEWLKIGCFDALPIDGFPAARHMYAKYHAISRTDFSLLPAMEPLCSQTRAEGAVGAELYLRLVVAAGCHDRADRERAAFHVSRALDLALPDGLYAPLAEARRNIGVLLDDMLYARDAAAFRAVCALWDKLIPAWTRLYEGRMGRALPAELTLRELEAAKYAAEGLTNGQIADVMHISVNTVRSHIRAAMQKADLQSRDAFAEYLHLS